VPTYRRLYDLRPASLWARCLRRVGLGALLCAAVLLPVNALAADAAPGGSADTTARQALQTLLEQQEARAGDSDYDYALGVAALQAGEPLLALDALERVVLHRPDFAGAWLDIALVHLQLGDADSADAVLASIEQNFAPPPALRRQIIAAREQIANWRSGRVVRELVSRWRGDISLLGGYSSNANAGIGVGGFTLTPVGGPTVPVDVAPDQRPRGSAMLQLRASAYRDFAHADGSVTSLLGYLRGRRFAGEGDFHYGEVALGVSHTHLLGSTSSANVGASLRHLQLGDESLATFYAVNAGLRRQLGACGMAASVEYEWRQYTRDGYFSAQVPWLGGGLDCRGGAHQWLLAARVGHDDPRGARAGGDTVRLEASAQWRWQISQRYTLEALVYYVRNRDLDGYSPLLANGAERRVERLGQRLVLGRDITADGRWRALLELENSRDMSNLPIFRLDERQVLLGVRYAF